jgi:hypothetical protein
VNHDVPLTGVMISFEMVCLSGMKMQLSNLQQPRFCVCKEKESGILL